MTRLDERLSPKASRSALYMKTPLLSSESMERIRIIFLSLRESIEQVELPRVEVGKLFRSHLSIYSFKRLISLRSGVIDIDVAYIALKNPSTSLNSPRDNP